MKESLQDLGALAAYDTVIDVRSPGEFAEDHIPGAINCPVLDDAEREQVGTLYKQVSAFEAKKVGAALVARNIARHLEIRFGDRPRGWRPLIYCWRGGNRSGAMTHILRAVGWQAHQLDGGYRHYRHLVRETLTALPAAFRLKVISGPTGSGKSRLLTALGRRGLQVLDLEGLARHRGSLLGSLPDTPQPSQKMFDSLIVAALRDFDPRRPVYVEAESKKVGAVRVPEALIARMWKTGELIRINAAREARIALLLEDYGHFLTDPAGLLEKLDHLAPLHSRATLDHWRRLVEAGDWEAFVGDLLSRHYDPAYGKSLVSHYGTGAGATVLEAGSLDEAGIKQLADLLAAREG